APVIRMVNLIITRAIESRASDIHIEPFEGTLKVRYRIDGVMHEVESPPARLTAAIISRLKIMAHLNIAERRLPQDGRIQLRVQGKEIDLRVSSVPTMHGESVVMRILDKGSITLDLDAMGFHPEVLARFKDVLALPHGIVLVTGPTGSGKTTTLYAALARLNTPERKILTVEDPVEYQIAGVNQIQANPKIGLDFAHALRSIVRQDPDVIMIGEMRDQETARIAIQSALTGHLVLSTVHTNDAASGVTRLVDMGLEPYLLTATVNCIMAQRLVRRLCPHCAEAFEAPPELVADLGLDRYAEARPHRLWRARGCPECADTGYHGRTAIHELLMMDEPIQRLVLAHADAETIEKAARARGMLTMYEDGLRKALSGITTVEEVLRVTQETADAVV
ncbi:MAG: type II secretion system ATPase GspE, partial [Ectothiorhodospiraceae bacterium]|nr:type II secretion system ATPase GspE [Ectothiorhodospiraceae bacterium]